MSMIKVNKKDNLVYGSLVRKIIRKSKTAVLSSHLNGVNWPYGSLVLSCCEHDGSPYVFISDLAEHTKAINMNNKVSIFYENCNFLDDPLTGTRFSVLCKAFGVHKKEEITINIYNVQGQIIEQIANGVYNIGDYSLVFNGVQEIPA